MFSDRLSHRARTTPPVVVKGKLADGRVGNRAARVQDGVSRARQEAERLWADLTSKPELAEAN